MKQRTKVIRLCAQIEDEHLELEHLYRVLKTNIQPTEGTGDAAYKVAALKNLKAAMDNLDEAVTWLRDIGKTLLLKDVR